MRHNGTVIKSTGSWYKILLDNGDQVAARIKGKFRLEGKKLTNPVAVGDRVEVAFQEGEAMIRQILERRNYVIRQSPRKRHDLHLIASNIDQAFVIATIVQPDLKQGFIDRFILMTEPHDIPTSIIINKIDLYDADAMDIALGLKMLYADIDYPVLLTSAITGEGLEAWKERLKGKVSLLGGQSGVGKSSLINAIQPDLDLKADTLSGYTGKGTHTTTFAEMHTLDFGGRIIDVPGIKTLSFNNLEPMDVAHNFREFFALAPECKYPDCMHRGEPKCAVKAAVESGDISILRYQNYLQILDEIEEQNYWERHRHM